MEQLQQGGEEIIWVGAGFRSDQNCHGHSFLDLRPYLVALKFMAGS